MRIEDLEPLIGEWVEEATFPNGDVMDAGRSTYAWLEGGGYLIQRSVSPAPFPNGVSVYGPTVEGDRIVQHYFDSRGVARVYDIALEHGVLRLSRDDEDFAQRYTGTFSDDGSAIEGAWERTAHDGTWVPDVALTYRRR